MSRFIHLALAFSFLFLAPGPAMGKELPRLAIWDLEGRGVKEEYARELTSILASEISKLEKYEVYTYETLRNMANWTAERMKLGCKDAECLEALGQQNIARLISGSVGKIGTTFSVSLHLVDVKNPKAEKSVSEFCRSEDDLIPLVQHSVRKLLGEPLISEKMPIYQSSTGQPEKMTSEETKPKPTISIQYRDKNHPRSVYHKIEDKSISIGIVSTNGPPLRAPGFYLGSPADIQIAPGEYTIIDFRISNAI